MTFPVANENPYQPVSPMSPAIPKACSYATALGVLKDRDLSTATHVLDWELMGGTVLTIDGPEHVTRRRLESALFKPQTLKAYEQEFLQGSIDGVLDDVSSAQRDPADGRVKTDLVRLGRMVMLSISAAVIGLDDLDRDGRRELLGDCTDALIEGILVEWADYDRQAEIMERARIWKKAYDENFVTPGLERRRREIDARAHSEDSRLDLLTLLLTDEGADWTHEAMVRECILFLVASTLTTSTAMTHTVNHLATWFLDHPEDRELVADASFLRDAARESLRLHPGPHVLLRRAPHSDDDGQDSSHTDLVGADLREANRDPEIYGEDADVFNPRRVLGKGVPAEGLTFGGGRHVCIGRPLALGTYGGQGADDIDGILVRSLRTFYGAGLLLDPDHRPVKANSAHDRFSSMPVILAGL